MPSSDPNRTGDIDFDQHRETLKLDCEKFKVMVVDDQDAICDLVQKVLSDRLGCGVLTTASGEQALDMLENTAVDVIILDMLMTGLHGIELIETVTQKQPELPIIAMTGHPQEFPYVEVIHAGADDFIKKPFVPDELEAKLLRLFRELTLKRERQLAESKYRSLFEMSSECMLMTTPGEYIILDANHAACAFLKRKRAQLLGMSIHDVLSDNSRQRFIQWDSLCQDHARGTLGDLTVFSQADARHIVDMTISHITAEEEQFVFLSLKDVTEKREVEEQLVDAAQRDALTGLLNKRSFNNKVAWAIQDAEENQHPLTMVWIDLDNFKQCNDTHGHQAGDELLSSVGAIIRSSIRADALDTGFRYGGDEFAIVLPTAGSHGGVAVANRIRESFENVQHFNTTLSIGVAEFKKGLSPNEFIKLADQALYMAKDAGKNTVQVL